MFTSVLKRAKRTGALALDCAGLRDVPVIEDWRLNERHYGGLTGLDKAETAAKHGDDQVKIWRRSYDMPPPPLAPGGEWDFAGDPRYAGQTIPRHRKPEDHAGPRPALLERGHRARA